MMCRKALVVLTCFLLSWGWAQQAAAEGEIHGERLAGFNASCTLLRGGDLVTVQVRAQNGSNVDLTGVTASHLDLNATGTAALRLTTTPTVRSELIRNNGHSFKWRGSLSGEGTLTICTDITAETPAGLTVTTGMVCCEQITLVKTPTITPRLTPTPRLTSTPILTRTARLTATPIATLTPRPTRTPRLTLTPEPTLTPRPTRTVRMTATPIPTRTPRTPIVVLTRTPRLTATPIPTRTPRTPIVVLTRTPRLTLTPRPTRTPRLPIVVPTRTPRTPGPTNTPREPRVTSTPRPTRTPLPTFSIDQEGLVGICRLVQTNDTVRLCVTVTNSTGARVTNVTVSDLNVDESGASLNLRGPSPESYSSLSNRARATFCWSGSIDGAGSAFVSAEATAVGLGGAPLSTGEVVCGAVTVEAPPPPPFDCAGLVARCTAGAFDGPVLISATLEIINGTGGDLVDVAPFGPAVRTTGTASISALTGPNPRAVRTLGNNKRARFKWRGHADGRGLAFLHVGVTATGPGGEECTTGSIECSTLVIPPRP